jgi:hypothetical protein
LSGGARLKKSLSFWVFVLVPWVLELLFGTRFFSSLLGSILWTSILIQGIIRSQVVDQRLRRGLFRSEIATFIVWNILWMIHLMENSDAHFGAGIPDLESKFWVQLHIALLTAGVAASLAVLTTWVLGWLQEKRLRSDSWNRRGQGIALPSLEGLLNSARFSARTGLLLWTMGSILAALTLALQRDSDKVILRQILLDDQILGVASFWLLQAATVFVAPRIFGRERANRGYILFSGLFLVSFVLWSITKQSNFHSPLRWLIP